MIYIIAGVSRSGKSILRQTITKKYGISGISLDFLREGLIECFPSLGIKRGQSDLIRSGKLAEYVNFLITNNHYDYSDIIIEGTNIQAKFLLEFRNNPEIKICFLGYTKIGLEQKKSFIKKFPGRNSWMEVLSEDKVDLEIEKYIERSKLLEKECELYGFKFFDTSEDFKKTLDEAEKYLIA